MTDKQQEIQDHLEKARIAEYEDRMHDAFQELEKAVTLLTMESFKDESADRYALKTEIKQIIYGIRNKFKVLTTYLPPNKYYETIVVGYPIDVEGGPWRSVLREGARRKHEIIVNILQSDRLDKTRYISPKLISLDISSKWLDSEMGES